MKKYKNILLSLGLYLLAFLWFVWWSKSIFGNLPIPADAFDFKYFWPHFLLIVVGIFFGWKSIERKEPPFMSNLITLIGIVFLIASLLHYMIGVGWSS